ncbi:MAG TPA: peptidoglycan-binding domain-containing protein, partial [Atopobiaceae bacterium]|nr:peptidoglycan-binding domain-containing protein [Atopobiaceae bacterium]
MEPIAEGSAGVAVEDIQERLSELGYTIDAAERSASSFGSSTASSVARFRLDHGLPLGTSIDTATWSALVDEGYNLGDRTLYLRLPNFHGRDVRQLQERLNILGFSCGAVDGCYGVHTEAAVRLFQESVGLLGDGMAFQETYGAIERLRHVWA